MITKILGFLILATSLAVVYLFETVSHASGAFRLLHWPAIVLTGVGPFGLVLLCSDKYVLKNAWATLREKSPAARQTIQQLEASMFHRLSHNYYVQGGKALDGIEKSQFSVPVQRVLERLAIRIPIQDVRDLLQREKERCESELSRSLSVFSLGVRLCPSVGMLGTILGMVNLLANMSDPSHIGSSMSLALLTTFYGLFFSLTLWTPLQHRLEGVLEVDARGYEQALHWLELLEQRKPAQYFQDYLKESDQVSIGSGVIQ